MIKTCLLSDLPIYGYSIDYNGEKLADCILLNNRDKGEIWASGKNQGEQSVLLIQRAVKKWYLYDKDGNEILLTADNIALIDTAIFAHLINEISAAEANAAKAVTDNEKN